MDNCEPMKTERSLQEKIGYAFRQLGMLRKALTHSSWANEQNCPQEHNERLEFLGDAVLELCISTLLFNRYPGYREGELTKIRAALVRETYLADLARKVGIPDALRLGRGEDQQAGRARASLLADALEAVLGAVYLDGGFEAAMRVVKGIFPTNLKSAAQPKVEKNPKCELQEICQKTFHSTPCYALVESRGPDHAPYFRVQLELPDGRKYWGEDTSRKKAEHGAALRALKDCQGAKAK